MALYSRIHTWVTNEILTASDLNNEFNNILNNAAATDLIGSSANVAAMQATADPGGVGTESLAGSQTDENQRLRYILKFLSGAAQWYVHTGRNLGAGNLAVQSADLASGAAIANIGVGGVTNVYTNAPNQTITNSSGAFTTSSTTPVLVTNLTNAITVSGLKPVRIELVSDGSANASYLSINSPGGTATLYVSLLKNGTQIASHIVFGNFQFGTFQFTTPSSAFAHIDRSTIGESPSTVDTYTVKAYVDNAANAGFVQYAKLVCTEMPG